MRPARDVALLCVLTTALTGCGSATRSSSGGGCSAFCEQAGPAQAGGPIDESCGDPHYPCGMFKLLTSSATIDSADTFRVRVRCAWQEDCTGAIAILKPVTDQTMSKAIRVCAQQPRAHHNACLTTYLRLGGSDFAVAHMSTAMITVALNPHGIQAIRRNGSLAPDVEAHINDHGKDVFVTDFRPRTSAGASVPFTLRALG